MQVRKPETAWIFVVTLTESALPFWPMFVDSKGVILNLCKLD